MTKKMLRNSGIGLLALVSLGIGNVGAADGGIYDGLRIYHDENLKTLGAQGPIRESETNAVQPVAGDIYASLRQFQSNQQYTPISSERGAQGPVRSETDMTLERNQQEWKKMLGVFATSPD